MEGHATRAAAGGDLGDGKEHAGLVVRPHKRHERGVFGEGGVERGEIQQPILAHRQASDSHALSFEKRGMIKHRRMLHRGCDDVPFARLLRSRSR